jgi:anti-anti-sigma factor
MESAPEFTRGLMSALGVGRSGLVVDLSRATFMDTSALHGLVHALERLREQGGRLALVAADPRINALFEVARIDDRFEIYPSRAEAISAVTA